jgi:YD repeat-containing protein
MRRRWEMAKRSRWLIAFVMLLFVCSAVPVLAAAPSDSAPPIPAEEGQVQTVEPGGETRGGIQLPTAEDMAATLDRFEDQEAEEQADLETPAAVQEREASQEAFADLDAAEAKELLMSQFPEVLAGLNADPSRWLSNAELDRPLGESESDATVTAPDGKTQLFEGSLPVRAENDEGGLEKVDLSLERMNEGWQPANPLVEVNIAESAEGGVEVGEDEPVTITQAGAEEGDARPLGDKNVFFGEVGEGTDTDLLVSPISSGVEIFDMLRSVESPEELRFQLEMPDGAELRSNGAGGAEVRAADDSILGQVSAPTAVDAQGASVPVALAVEGSSIVLHVDHREREVAYPVLVDPIYQDWGWWYSGQHLSGLSAWGWNEYQSGWLYHGYNDTMFPGWGGLFIASGPGGLPGGQWGQWVYSAPNAQTYLSNAVINPFSRNNRNCSASSYPQPYDYDGMWNETSWNRIVYNEANNQGWSQIESWGRAFIVGMGTSGGISIPCWRDLALGGVGVWLEDWDHPTLEWATGMPEEWVNGTTPFVVSNHSTDAGLGVHNITISPQGALPISITPNGCTGAYESPCPHDWTGQVTLTGAAFDQGERTAQISAEDPTLKASATYPYTTRVDRTGPEITLAGQFGTELKEAGPGEKQGEGGPELNLPVYNVKVEAVDGSNASPATKRSGVKRMEVFVDGTLKQTYSKASCWETSCPMTQTYPLTLTGLAGGKHKLKVVVADFVENKETREIEFEYVPATGISDDFILQRFPLNDGKDHSGEDVNHGPELAVNVMNGNLVFHQRDFNVEGPNADLEVERFYNSQLPKEQSSEWGRGWTLSQTPKLEKTTSGGSGEKGTVMTTSAVLEGGVKLPESTGQQGFSPQLHAMLSKQAGGGYALSEEGGTTVLDSAGKTTEVSTGPYAKVDYDYTSGKLSEISVDDPASTTSPPAEIKLPPSTVPTYVSALGSSGTGNGQFAHPADVAIDAKGNIWVADENNHRLEEFNEKGEFLKTLGANGAGNGQFTRPKSIAFAANGSFWVADSGNSRLEQFNEKGEFLKAVGGAGSGNGQFSGPEGIAIDAKGNIWVADTYNYRVQELNAAGEFIKVVNPAGLGAIEPTGLDVGPGGNVWVADWAHNRVVELSEAGGLIRQFGSAGTGNGQFAQPDTVTVDSKGNVWVGDQNNGRIQGFNQSGEYVTQFGAKGSGTGQFSFSYPFGIATDNKGNLWIADANNNRLQKWQIPHWGPTYSSSFGSAGTGNGQFSHPADTAVDPEGNVWVVDDGNNRIQKFNSSGQYLTKFGSAGTGNGQFSQPKSIAFDTEGNYWVADAGNSRLEQFNEKGTFIKAVGGPGSGNGKFAGPESIAIAPNGNIWVADTYNYRVQVLNEKGEFIKVVNPAGMGAIEPTGIAIGPGGKAWVADWAHNRVVVLSEGGELVRQFGSAGTGNGQFSHPDAVDVTSRGDVWVLDQSNARIQRFNQAGEYVAQFGSAGTGTGQFSFSYPAGITADTKGNLWIADTNNNRIQKWQSGITVPSEEEGTPVNDDPAVAVATTSGLVNSVKGTQAGSYAYVHEGELLTAVQGPGGTTTYAYDASPRMTKVTLPNGSYGEVKYDTSGRATKVSVKQAGSSTITSTFFTYVNNTGEARETTIESAGKPTTHFAIGADGSVLKWWNSAKAPDFRDHAGSLWEAREERKKLEPGDQSLFIEGHDTDGVASIQFVANGSTVVDEKTCAQNYEVAGTECEYEHMEWVTTTGDLPPGTLYLEAIVTDSTGAVASERFWVNIPYTPPPPPEQPVPPKFKEVQQFREEFGLDLNPPLEELELHDRIFDLLGAWHNPGTPLGEVARASWERWGVPLRPVDVAELEYREWFYNLDAERINRWVEETSPSTFAGYYIDHRAGGIMHIGFTANQAESLASLVTSLSLVGGERLQVYPTTPNASYLSVQASAESVASAIESNPALREQVVSVGTDEAGRVVHVGTPNVAQVESTLHQMFGANAPVAVEFEANEGSLLGGRYRNEGRMRAGDGIFARHFTAATPAVHDGNVTCTAGFGAKDKAGEAQGQPLWRLFVLTAGHCTPTLSEKRIYRSTDSYNLNESHWKEVGEVTRNAYRVLDESPTTDAEAIKVEDAGVVPQGIWGSGGGLLPTEPAGTAKKGDVLCFSGVITGVSCGEVIGRTAFWAGAGDGVAHYGYWVHFNHPAQHGDSGAPVYSVSGQSIGLISAGRHNLTQTLVQPLLPPPGMKAGKAPGVLNNPHLRPLSLKLGE